MENQIGIKKGHGICPVCNGSGRTPAGDDPYKHVYAGYDKVSDTLRCNNCGAAYAYGTPSGRVPLREDGTPCKHEYKSVVFFIGRCLTRYTCGHCMSSHEIDSED